jgi:hypothetical protein
MSKTGTTSIVRSVEGGAVADLFVEGLFVEDLFGEDLFGEDMGTFSREGEFA